MASAVHIGLRTMYLYFGSAGRGLCRDMVVYRFKLRVVSVVVCKRDMFTVRHKTDVEIRQSGIWTQGQLVKPMQGGSYRDDTMLHEYN